LAHPKNAGYVDILSRKKFHIRTKWQDNNKKLQRSWETVRS